MNNTPSSYVIIGAGLMGSATAWKLADRGHQVTILERSTPANANGSSHGSARILRYAYPDAFYTQLMVSAAVEWALLESESQSRLISPTGAVDFGTMRMPGHLASVLNEVGVENVLLTAKQARDRWPHIAFDTDVVWHAGAGVVDPERSVNAMLSLAERNGAVLHNDWTVASVVASDTGYRVTSTTGATVSAENVVVCVGGWLPETLGDLGLPDSVREKFPRLEVREEQAYHFPYRDKSTEWPALIHKRRELEIYALPGGADAGHRGMKVAQYNGGHVIESASKSSGEIDPANRERVISYVKQYLPGLVPEPYAETTCLFTNAPNDDFVIDRIDGITIVSSCSGHGGKFAPLIGRIAADLADGSREIPQRFRSLTLVS